MSKRIIIFFEPWLAHQDISRWAIFHLSKFWQSDGLEVKFVYGPNETIQGDLAILHVDLSVVPQTYVQVAKQFPIALNTKILDIRKHVHSKLLVKPGDGYTGPVIVKSDQNYAGIPERKSWSRLRRLFSRYHLLSSYPFPLRKKQDYKIFSRRQDVPSPYFQHPNLVVEKFLPERDGDRYCIRNCYVLGDRILCDRVTSSCPIIDDSTAEEFGTVAVPPGVSKLCEAMKLDYGKLDLTIHQGELVVFDINKTVGASRSHNPKLEQNRRYTASGLYAFLNGSRTPY